MDIIKNYSVSNAGKIRRKLAILYLLNVLDILLTLVLLETGIFIEANPIVASIINEPIQLFLAKVFLPAVLCLFLSMRIENANESQLDKSNFIINGALLVYLAINIGHVLWISLYNLNF